MGRKLLPEESPYINNVADKVPISCFNSVLIVDTYAGYVTRELGGLDG